LNLKHKRYLAGVCVRSISRFYRLSFRVCRLLVRKVFDIQVAPLSANRGCGLGRFDMAFGCLLTRQRPLHACSRDYLVSTTCFRILRPSMYQSVCKELDNVGFGFPFRPSLFLGRTLSKVTG